MEKSKRNIVEQNFQTHNHRLKIKLFWSINVGDTLSDDVDNGNVGDNMSDIGYRL